MKNEILLDAIIPTSYKRRMQALINSQAMTLSSAMKAAGVSTRRSLRHTDLQGFDLSDLDFRNSDLSGADLRNTFGLRVKWDPQTTILDGAQTEGSIFQHRIEVAKYLRTQEGSREFKKLRGLAEDDIVVWALKALNPRSRRYAQDRLVASALLAEEDLGGFLKGELLQQLSKGFQDETRMFEFLLDYANVMEGNSFLINTILKILGKSEISSSAMTLDVVRSLLNSSQSRVRVGAGQYLVTHLRSPREIRAVIEFAQKEDELVRNAIISELLKRLGPIYDLIARDPSTGDYRTRLQAIGAYDLTLLLRNIVRRRQDANALDRTVFLSAFPRGKEESFVRRLRAHFDRLSVLGLKYRYRPRAFEQATKQFEVDHSFGSI